MSNKVKCFVTLFCSNKKRMLLEETFSGWNYYGIS